jgi:hypothetical protein
VGWNILRTKTLQDFAGRTRYVCNAICSERRPPGLWRRHLQPQAAGLKPHVMSAIALSEAQNGQLCMTAERGRCRCSVAIYIPLRSSADA